MFTWDLANRLASTTDSGSTTGYGYDGDGTRLQATTGVSATNYLSGPQLRAAPARARARRRR